MLARMVKTEHPLLLALAGAQTKVANITVNRAYTVNKKGMVTFLPKGKAPEWGENGGWAKKNRQETKIGRALRDLAAQRGLVFKDSEFEQATYCLQAQVVAEGAPDFELVRGEAIEHYYRYGPKMGSCMSGYKEQDTGYGFDLYNSNPQTIGCLVLHGKSRTAKDIQAKAMVFFDRKGVGHMSRVYVTKDVHTKIFEEYAKSMGWKNSREWGMNVIIPITRHCIGPSPSLDNGWNTRDGLCLHYRLESNRLIDDYIKERYGLNEPVKAESVKI